ncbi:MAG TPA: DUF1501 domain-containing protein, partial [Stellaceae bacterium]|nr:DUF1501 domain-containing protein [Stellaceae bacterium]
MILARRHVLAGAAGMVLTAGLHRAAFAAAPTDQRFIVVLLRGAQDGLATVPPYGDPRYAERRTRLALKPPGEPGGVVALDKFFGLHPALAPLAPYYQKGELLVVPASGNGYNTRSHFDAQDLMESGLAVKGRESDGWLNRALGLMKGGDHRLGLAVGGAVPRILRGSIEVASWQPEKIAAASPDFVSSLESLYRRDPLLGPALQAGLASQNFSNAVLGDDSMAAQGGYGPGGFRPLAEVAGKLLAADDGPRIASLDMLGWDTHVNQGADTGRLAQNFTGFADGLDAMAKALGPAWRKSVVVTVTEFGRTVAVNGNDGTDHGTGAAMLVMGGAVKGGRAFGDWPGLDTLVEDRDL